MKITINSGRYVIAVSGGVDSVVLLHIVQSMPGVDLTVAHFDHGIRPDSAYDRRFVEALAQKYGLPFVCERAELGQGASEDLARQKRYAFLGAARRTAGASAVLTAHHRDDVLETALFNIIRGTGRRGMSSLKSTDSVIRPLLGVSKSEILEYAREHRLKWHDDSTNRSDAYARNYIRHNIVTRLSAEEITAFMRYVTESSLRNDEIDLLLGELILRLSDKKGMRRSEFTVLPHSLAKEVMATWLRQYKIRDINAKMIERLVHAAKTFAVHSRTNVADNWVLTVGNTYLALEAIER